MSDQAWAAVRVREMLERVRKMAATEWLRLANELLGPASRTTLK